MREPQWSEAIAVGRRAFVKDLQRQLGLGVAVVCVPGFGNRLVAALGSSAPRRISSRLLGAVMKRAGSR